MLSHDAAGRGPLALVFLHGFGGSRLFWRQQLDGFSSVTQCIAVDLPGHGESPWEACSLSDMAGQVMAVLRKSGVQRAHLVGSSFGGLVALEMWRQWPPAFSAVTLVGSLPRFTAEEGFPAGLSVPRIRKLAGQFKGDVGPVLDMFLRSLFTMKERSGEQYGEIKKLRQLAPLPRREALLAMLDILEQSDLRDLFIKVDVPLQLIAGDGDHICPPSAVEALRAIKPSVRVDMFAGCGHFPFLSRPREFNFVLKEFAGL